MDYQLAKRTDPSSLIAVYSSDTAGLQIFCPRNAERAATELVWCFGGRVPADSASIEVNGKERVKFNKLPLSGDWIRASVPCLFWKTGTAQGAEVWFPLQAFILLQLEGINWSSQMEYVHTLHSTHVKSHLTFRKRICLCGRWWWMTVHQYTREGNSLKPTKMCSLENGLWLLK